VSATTDRLGVLRTVMVGKGRMTGAARLAAAADTTGLRSPASMASWLKLKLPLQDRLEWAARSEPAGQALPVPDTMQVMLLSIRSPASSGTSSCRPRSLTLPVLVTEQPYKRVVPAEYVSVSAEVVSTGTYAT
jgi:hypothetical protein